MLVSIAVTVEVAYNVSVAVLTTVVEGVGIERQEQALEIAELANGRRYGGILTTRSSTSRLAAVAVG